MELFLRISGVGYGNAPLERSQTYHHVHPSNYQFLMHDPNGEYGGYHVYYDDIGFRVANEKLKTNDLKHEKNTIIFMGDSFTEGNQVVYHKTFASLVSEKLGVPAINLGVSSYAPLIYELQVKNILSQFDAEVVVLQIFSNDFEEGKVYLKNAVLDSDEIIGINGGRNNFAVSIARNSYLLRFLRKSQLLLQVIFSKSKVAAEIPSSAFDYEQDVTDEQLYSTVNIIRRINSLLAEQDKKLYVFLIPSRSLSFSNSCCAEDKLYARFYSAMLEAGIETIDVKSSFEQSEKQHELFFMKDIHLTSEGHRLVAESIGFHLVRD